MMNYLYNDLYYINNINNIKYILNIYAIKYIGIKKMIYFLK